MDEGEVRIPGDDEEMDVLEHGLHALEYRGNAAKELGEATVAVFPVARHRTTGVIMHRCFCGEFGTLRSRAKHFGNGDAGSRMGESDLVQFLTGELELCRAGDAWCRCEGVSSKCNRCQAPSCFSL